MTRTTPVPIEAALGVSIAEAWKDGIHSLLDAQDCPKDPASRRSLADTLPKPVEEAAEDLRELIERYEKDPKIAPALQVVRPLVEGLQKVQSFGTVVAGLNPAGAAPLVWGATRVLLQVVAHYHHVIDKLHDFRKDMETALAELNLLEKAAASPEFHACLQHMLRDHSHFCLALANQLEHHAHGWPWPLRLEGRYQVSEAASGPGGLSARSYQWASCKVTVVAAPQ